MSQQEFETWWHNEGSGMSFLKDGDVESHTRQMTEIAWSNGEHVMHQEMLEQVNGLKRDLEGAWANRNHFCHHINIIGHDVLGFTTDSCAPDAVSREVAKLVTGLREQVEKCEAKWGAERTRLQAELREAWDVCPKRIGDALTRIAKAHGIEEPIVLIYLAKDDEENYAEILARHVETETQILKDVEELRARAQAVVTARHYHGDDGWDRLKNAIGDLGDLLDSTAEKGPQR